MHPDWQLVALLVFLTWFLTSVFWVAYGSYRADQMRQQHIAEQDVLRMEISEAAKMVAKTEFQMRVLGATPVSRLIGNDDGR